MDVSGHLALALLFAAPARFVWGQRASLAFVGFSLLTAMLPDVDLLLRHVFPTIQHHGVTHTVFFVLLASVVGGVLTAGFLTDRLNAPPGSTASRSPRRRRSCSRAVAFSSGVWPTSSRTCSPHPTSPPRSNRCGPLYRQPIVVDVIYYDSPIWNSGLLAVAIAIRVGLYRWEKYPIESAYRIGGESAPSILPGDTEEKR